MKFQEYTEKYLDAMNTISVRSGNGDTIEFDAAVDNILILLKETKLNSKKVIFFGNGGSASIASHQAIDFWKNGGIRALAFNDSSLLTCISNDYSYAEVFSKPLEMFADNGDIVIAISSSGNSENIINAANVAKKMGCFLITMSGFRIDNKLIKLGSINFYLNSSSYGLVEIGHTMISHFIIDKYIQEAK